MAYLTGISSGVFTGIKYPVASGKEPVAEDSESQLNE